MKKKKKRATRKQTATQTARRPQIGGVGIEPGTLSPPVARGRRRVISPIDRAMEKLAEQFCKLLDEEEMTAAKLARTTDVAPASIVKIQTHSKIPQLRTLLPLLEALDAELVIRKKPARKRT